MRTLASLRKVCIPVFIVEYLKQNEDYNNDDGLLNYVLNIQHAKWPIFKLMDETSKVNKLLGTDEISL